MDPTFLLFSFALSTIGLAYFVFGKRQRRPVPLAVGVGLMALPYFVSDPVTLGGIGAALMALAYFVRAWP